MTNAKISPKALTILKNKGLSSAIAKELITNAHAAAREGLNVLAGGKRVRVQIASSRQYGVNVTGPLGRRVR